MANSRCKATASLKGCGTRSVLGAKLALSARGCRIDGVQQPVGLQCRPFGLDGSVLDLTTLCMQGFMDQGQQGYGGEPRMQGGYGGGHMEVWYSIFYYALL